MILFFRTSPIFAQPAQELPRIAVYVTGGKTANENNMFAGQITHALVNSGRFLTIERADVFIEQVEREHTTQRSGAIDDRQISRLGQQAGAQFVCIVQIVDAFGGHQISARIVNVETVAITYSGIALGELRDINDFRMLSQEVITTLLGVTVRNQQVQQRQQPTARAPTSAPTVTQPRPEPRRETQVAPQATTQVSAPQFIVPPSGVVRGTFTDSRDNQTYRIVTIGNQTWMAENLNYQVGNSWCYLRRRGNCKEFGRLYDWDTAMEACPAGWRLPSSDDWTILTNAVGGVSTAGMKLKSRTHWQSTAQVRIISTSTDEYGFTALPGGNRFSNGNFNYVNNLGLWWTATEVDTISARSRRMVGGNRSVMSFTYEKTRGLSVRCIMN